MKPDKSGKSMREFPSDLHEAILITLIPYGKKGAYSLDIMDELNSVYQKCGLKNIDMGSLYPAFKRMSEKGWIQGRWGDDNLEDEESGGARRRYYFIANSGIIALNELRDYRMQLQRNQTFPIPEYFLFKFRFADHFFF
jgi:PadR family transcriptional regulator, regulatory protein PadR